MTWKDAIRKAPSEKIKRMGAEYLKGVNSDVFEKIVLEQTESLTEGLEFHIKTLEGHIKKWKELGVSKPFESFDADDDIYNAEQTVYYYKKTLNDLKNIEGSVKKVVEDLENAEDSYEDLYSESGTTGREKPPHY